MNELDLKLSLKQNILKGLEFNSNDQLPVCEVCIKSKMNRLPFPNREEQKVTKTLEVIHSDVCGPMRYTSNAGAKYFVTFIDENTRYCRVYFLKHKNEVLEKFKEFKNEVERYAERKIKFLQTDNGTEYCNSEFDKYLKDCGIQRRLSAPYTPQQNGLAERKNRTLLEKARCLLIESNLGNSFWAEAINTANYLCNRTPSRVINNETPFYRWVGRHPSVRHLQVFGSKAFVLNKKPNQNKFESRASVGIFVGYSEISKAYRIWMPNQKKVHTVRDVKILNKQFNILNKDGDYEFVIENSEDKGSVQDEIEIEFEFNTNKKKTDTTQESVQPKDELNEKVPRTRKPPTWSEDYDMSYYVEENNKSFSEDENPKNEEWKEAIKDEFRAHLKNDTWVIIDKKPDFSLIDSKLILKRKYDSDGVLERKKARLVARGFAQRPGVDYNETFAPVAKLSSIRLVCAIAAQENMKIHHMDVSTAFLNGEIDEQVYMRKPELLDLYLSEIMVEESTNDDLSLFHKAKTMLEDLRKGNTEKICLLKRAIYGLKQAGRQWFVKLDRKLRDLGFKSSQDPCVYTQMKENEKTIIAIYVDDILLSSSNEEKLNEIKLNLMSIFEMRDLKVLKYCLGIEVVQENQRVSISQKKYIKDLLMKFDMENCNPVTTPMEPGLKLEKCQAADENIPYQNLIGSLLYLSVATRPDIAYAVSYLSQYNKCCDKSHWQAAKRVLRYLQGTLDYTLTYSKCDKPLFCFTDADWAACQLDRKSYTGYCFIFANAAISWESRKQRSVALSTAEAEYMALTEAAKEAVHLRQLVNDLGIPLETVTILNDNQAAQKMSRNPIVSNKSKHINIREHYIRDLMKQGSVRVEYCKGDEMAADILTKAVGGPRLNEFLDHLGIKRVKRHS